VRSEQARRKVGETVSDADRDDRALDRSVLALAREIADKINAGPTEGRDVLREMAVNALRDQVYIGAPPVAEEKRGQAAFNPLGIGIPLVFVGAILVALFPPVGFLMFGTAAVMVIWGVLATLFGRRYSRDQRGS
jgi:hypothetical protein